MKINLVIYSLDMGGAERVMSIMANHWASQGHDVTLITLLDSQDYYQLDNRVCRIRLDKAGSSDGNIWKAAKSNIARVNALRRVFKKLTPDVIISFTARINVITLLAAYGLDIPVLVSERTDPTQAVISRPWQILRHLMYRWAYTVVVQSNDALLKSQSLFSGSRTAVIPNPVSMATYESNDRQYDIKLRALAGLHDSAHIIAGMGRFDFAKGFDLLIEAFALIADRYSDWFLVLIGDGRERETLHQMIVNHGLGERVFLVGPTKTPQSLLSQTDIFVLPSRFEGFPNALLEAMACGVAVISFDCPSGPRDIIRPNHDGILVESKNSEALAQAIEEMILNPATRKQLGDNAREVLSRFSVSMVMGLWQSQIPHMNWNDQGGC
ncbi:MAG: glycosyltransferase family 4 protein [Gammaproteobacteria bacterium]